MQLSKWKCRSLNKAGRAILTSSTLNNIPAYWFQLFYAPKTVIKQIDRIRRDFFWNEIDESSTTWRKLHSIGWNKVILPKDLGGLGLFDLTLKNIALMSKWWWKLNHDRNKLWHKIIIGKYGGEISTIGVSSVLTVKKFSPIMLSVLQMKNIQSFNNLLSEPFKWIARDGASIYF